MSDFGVGLVVGQSMGKSNFAEMYGIALGWRDRAERLTAELDVMNYKYSAAVVMMKNLVRELGEANPESDYADSDFVRQQLAAIATQLAHEDGYEIDLKNYRVTPLR